MTNTTTEVNGAESVVWNLSDLFNSSDDPLISATMADVRMLAQQFADTYRGRVASLHVEELADAMRAQEMIFDNVARLYSFASLQWTTNTADSAFGALVQRIREFYAEIQQLTMFFDLEWSAVEDGVADQLMADPELARFKHYLTKTRKLRPYRLSEPEEKILAEKAVTGVDAWGRFYGQMLSSVQYDLDGKKVPQETVLKQLYAPNRERRMEAAKAVTEGLRTILPTSTYVFNVRLADKASDDRLRKFPTWITSRNMENETTDAAVDTLVNAVTSRYDIVQRYYRVKRHWLGYVELYDYDRYAPMLSSETHYKWQEAQRIVLDSFNAFHPTIGSIAAEFFDKHWIHAPVATGKRGGAYASPVAPSVHPYIFVNFTGRSRDVMTLAHELGHGIHMYLSRPHGVFGADTPLTTAETASVFGEMMVFNNLIAREQDPKAKISMLAGKIEDTFATVFRQISMNRFEDKLHTARRTQGELSTDQINAMWMDTQQAMFGDTVTLRDDYGIWWSYINHFIAVPGYVYAYAFGELLVMALVAEYRKQGDKFAPKYIEMLSSGGSDTPENIMRKVDVDLTDPHFWQQGLNMIDAMVEELETLVSSVSH